mmetsp:Transcript_23554/g.64092  ORF Transcript_23554/g.64092 Transcript_23554/m.64092 type:complete len:425 (-) Transcript_23554:201-1475(-)
MLQGLHLLLRDRDDKVHGVLGVVLLEVLNLSAAGALRGKHGSERLLVVLRPAPDGQLRDLQRRRAPLLDHADNVVAVLVGRGHDAALEAGPPGAHLLQGLAPNVPLQVRDDVARRVVGQGGGPAGSDPIGAVDQQHGQHGNVPDGLDGLALLQLELEDLVVRGVEDQARHLLEARVDVTRAGGILASLKARAELPGRRQEVQVVGADKVLGQRDDGSLQRDLAVVVGGLLRDVAGQLRHLDVVLHVPLEGRPHDLPLHGLEAVHDRGDAAEHIVLGKLHELLLDKVRVGDLRLRVVHELVVVGGVDPLLAVVRALLVEGQVDEAVVLFALELKVQRVGGQVAEVLLRLLRGGSAQSLVVLDVPTLTTVVLLLPVLVLLHREEGLDGAAPGHLHDRSHELLHEPGQFEEGWPPMLHHIQDEALNV